MSLVLLHSLCLNTPGHFCHSDFCIKIFMTMGQQLKSCSPRLRWLLSQPPVIWPSNAKAWYAGVPNTRRWQTLHCNKAAFTAWGGHRWGPMKQPPFCFSLHYNSSYKHLLYVGITAYNSLQNTSPSFKALERCLLAGRSPQAWWSHSSAANTKALPRPPRVSQPVVPAAAGSDI